MRARIHALILQGQSVGEIAAALNLSLDYVHASIAQMRARNQLPRPIRILGGVPATWSAPGGLIEAIQAVQDGMVALEAAVATLVGHFSGEAKPPSAPPTAIDATPSAERLAPPAAPKPRPQSRLSEPPPVDATEREIRDWAALCGMFFVNEVNIRRVNTARSVRGLPPFRILAEARAAE